jgi:hypothetical protein
LFKKDYVFPQPEKNTFSPSKTKKNQSVPCNDNVTNYVSRKNAPYAVRISFQINYDESTGLQKALTCCWQLTPDCFRDLENPCLV